MLTEIVATTPRDKIVEGLTRFRQEWEGATQGESLLNVKGSIGLILYDLASAFELNEAERLRVLGLLLFFELYGGYSYVEQ